MHGCTARARTSPNRDDNGEGKVIGHILIPRGHYIGQVREYGYQKYKTVTGKCRTAEAALSKAALKMKHHHRARVLFIDSSPYYEPHVVMEAIR